MQISMKIDVSRYGRLIICLLLFVCQSVLSIRKVCSELITLFGYYFRTRRLTSKELNNFCRIGSSKQVLCKQKQKQRNAVPTHHDIGARQCPESTLVNNKVVTCFSDYYT